MFEVRSLNETIGKISSSLNLNNYHKVVSAKTSELLCVLQKLFLATEKALLPRL
jgi:hypothetical protein